jgi:hypothetical protein
MPKMIQEIVKYSAFISNKGNRNSRKSKDFDNDEDDDDFVIKNNKSSVIIGDSTDGHGRVSLNGEKIVDGDIRCLTIGTSGSGKSYLTRNIIESLYTKRLGIVVVIDPEGEYYTLRKLYDFVIIGIDEDLCDIVITEENASDLANKMLKYKINVIFDLRGTDDNTRREIASQIIDAMIESKHNVPISLVIEEASRFASKGINSPSNIKCTMSLKKIAQFGRKRQISAFYNTQRVTHLHKDISAECNTTIIGRCSDDADIKRNATKIGLKNIFELKKLKHEFFAWGDGFDHADFNTYVRFKSFPTNSDHMKSPRRDAGAFPYPESETVMKWIGLMGGLIKGPLKQILAEKAMEEKQLSLIPEIKEQTQQTFRGLSDKIESIPKPKRFDDDDLPDSLSEACEICGRTAIANGRCNNHADYESFGRDPNQVKWDEDEDFDEDENEDDER